MRTVIYARFSSDNQNPRSTADQIAICRERAAREGWTIVAAFEDAAISGAAGIAANQRPGLNAMLALVEAGGIDQVLAESTDRISRHVADAHIVRERIEFAGARLFTLFDGNVTPIVGLVKGFMDAQFRTDLAQRVKRGQRSGVASGRVSGGLAYGYRRANRLDERGELIRGLREVDEDQAAIVRRVFAEFVGGFSANKIARRLNAERVPAPKSELWSSRVLQGTPANLMGILRNPVYVGRILYGRTRVVVNPVTRQRLMKANTTDPRTEGEAPHLRIIDDATWDRAQELLALAVGKRPELMRRPKHLLSGLGVCGQCGATWVRASGEFWGCSRFRRGGACTNNRLINTHKFERAVLGELKAGLLAPDVVQAYVREYHSDFARKAADLGRDRARLERRLADATRRYDRLVAAIAAGGAEFAEIRAQLAHTRDERDEAQRALASMDAVPQVLALHPRLEEEYRRQIDALDEALAAPEAELEAVPRLRAMIARIVLTPGPKKRGVEVQVVRQMDEILAIATKTPARA